jgi:hypothetical protein
MTGIAAMKKKSKLTAARKEIPREGLQVSLLEIIDIPDATVFRNKIRDSHSVLGKP